MWWYRYDNIDITKQKNLHLGLKAGKVFQRLRMTEYFQETDSGMQPRKAILKHSNKDFEQYIVDSSISSVSDSSSFGNF